jgi:hypothetical protein
MSIYVVCGLVKKTLGGVAVRENQAGFQSDLAGLPNTNMMSQMLDFSESCDSIGAEQKIRECVKSCILARKVQSVGKLVVRQQADRQTDAAVDSWRD